MSHDSSASLCISKKQGLDLIPLCAPEPRLVLLAEEQVSNKEYLVTREVSTVATLSTFALGTFCLISDTDMKSSVYNLHAMKKWDQHSLHYKSSTPVLALPQSPWGQLVWECGMFPLQGGNTSQGSFTARGKDNKDQE